MPNISRSIWSQISNATASSSKLAPALLTSTRELPSDGRFFQPTDKTTFLPNGEGKSDPKGKRPVRVGDEVEVDDQEWAIRVGSGILHLRATLPHIFDSNPPTNLFPPTVYSNSVSLSLPPPLPLKISTLPLYSMTFSLARHGMHALHTDLDATLHKLAVSPGSSGSARESGNHPSPLTSEISKRFRKPGGNVQRDRKVRVILEVCGLPRLGAQREPTSWQTSSLYTFSPISGLIIHHQVETIRPLPGESVGAWLNERLWGWNVRAGQSEGYQTAPLGAWSGGTMQMQDTPGDRMIRARVVVEDVVETARRPMEGQSGTKHSRHRPSGRPRLFPSVSWAQGIQTRRHLHQTRSTHRPSTSSLPLSSLSSILQTNPELRDVEEAMTELNWIISETRSEEPWNSLLKTDGDDVELEKEIEKRVRRRGKGEPIQYILGNTDFGPLRLRCQPPILIPRPETADVFTRLAELILTTGRFAQGTRGRVSRGKETSRLRILDLYTGSGCIALLMDHLLRHRAGLKLDLFGVDINLQAIRLSLTNARSLDVPLTSSRFFQGDIMHPEFERTLRRWMGGEGKVDLVLANPPYIPRGEYEGLSVSVREWEDERALVGVEMDGLGHYRRVAGMLRGLVEHGREHEQDARDDVEDGTSEWDTIGLPRIAVEIGDGQGDDVERILRDESRGFIQRTECWKDGWGRERLVVGWASEGGRHAASMEGSVDRIAVATGEDAIG